jgi:hypothetical protein
MSAGLSESHEPANSEVRATASASKANGEQQPVSGPAACEQMWQKCKRFCCMREIADFQH